MLSVTKYLVSDIEVLQSEKKMLKLKSLLKLYSASKGIIKIRDFFLELNDTASKGQYDKEFVTDFPYENVEVRVNDEGSLALLYTTVYVACKLIHKVHCE